MEAFHSKAVSQMIHYRLRRNASRVRKLTRCGMSVQFDPMSQHFVALGVPRPIDLHRLCGFR
jgi:hypothetical protein